MEGIKIWMNFCSKIKQITKNGFWRENELNVFTLGANNTCYLIYPWRNKGALTWFSLFGTTMWNLLIIELFFHWIFWKNQDWKHKVWCNKVNFIILRLKMWTILFSFWWVLLLEIQKNCKKRFGRKIQLNAFKLGPMT